LLHVVFVKQLEILVLAQRRQVKTVYEQRLRVARGFMLRYYFVNHHFVGKPIVALVLAGGEVSQVVIDRELLRPPLRPR
jgi:hypothetical protein